MSVERDFWMPQFEVRVIEELGQEWPTGYAVSRWEQNAIGERRYTGQTRTYTYLDRDALARALQSDRAFGWLVSHFPHDSFGPNDPYWMDKANSLIAMLSAEHGGRDE